MIHNTNSLIAIISDRNLLTTYLEKTLGHKVEVVNRTLLYKLSGNVVKFDSYFKPRYFWYLGALNHVRRFYAEAIFFIFPEDDGDFIQVSIFVL